MLGTVPERAYKRVALVDDSGRITEAIAAQSDLGDDTEERIPESPVRYHKIFTGNCFANLWRNRLFVFIFGFNANDRDQLFNDSRRQRHEISYKLDSDPMSGALFGISCR